MGKGTYFVTLHKPVPVRQVPVGTVGGHVVMPLHLPAENETSKGSQDDEEVHFPLLYNINYKFMANFSRLLASLTICLMMIHLWNWVLQSSETSLSSILMRKWI